MSENTKIAVGWLALVLGVAVYLLNPGSEHAATNQEEYAHWQATRVTAEGGAWLPAKGTERNATPPALVWQGIVATDWARHWELWRLRLPVALYTLVTAALVLLLARRLSGSTGTGLLAATLFLAFFGTYCHGRMALASAAETFWFFLPFFILLCRPPRGDVLAWSHALAFGSMVGFGLLYGSYAVAISFCACLAWWTLSRRGRPWTDWIRRDAPKIVLLGIVASGFFLLCIGLVSFPPKTPLDVLLEEGAAKIGTAGGIDFTNFLSDRRGIRDILACYPYSVGLLAPAMVALFVMTFRTRRTLADAEKLLWIWIMAQVIVSALPRQHGGNHWMPALPAMAVLAALHWSQIPRWTMSITLLASGTIVLVLLLGGLVLTGELAEGPIYPWYFAPFMATIAGIALVAILRADWTRAAAVPAVLFVYLAYALFSMPFEGPRGRFARQTIDAVQGRTVFLPATHDAQEEIYRFMLPGAVIEPVPAGAAATIAELRTEYPLFILTAPCSNTALAQYPGMRIIGDRLRLTNPLGGTQHWRGPHGDITGRMFRKDLLIEIDK